MVYLLLSILSSAAIVLIFKGFDRYRINTFQAIVVNYFVASGLGYLLVNDIGFSTLPEKPWFEVSLLVGFLFIIMFYMIALTAQKIGVSVSAVSQKMSVVVPVIVAVILYGDTMNLLKGSGILLALFGVYLTSRRKESIKLDRQMAILPLLVFLGSGFLDSTMNYVERYLLNAGEKDTETFLYVSTLFLVAAILGALFLGLQFAMGKAKTFPFKNVLAGFALGVPNFGSIYFLLRTLDAKFLEDSSVFPINNMGIVAASTLGAVIIFREHLSPKNKIGVAISVAAIAMIAFSE